MRVLLFPRLAGGNAELWSERFSQLSPGAIAEKLPELKVDGVRYPPTGGQRVQTESLEALRRDLVTLADRSGYPEKRSLGAQRRFDLGLARLLDGCSMIRGEALRDEVWQYLTCILVPDIVAWRYGKTRESEVTGPTNRARFLGGPRNMIQRIWWRTAIFRDNAAEDPLWLIDTGQEGLTEDNMVALLERGNIAGYQYLCRTIALEFVRCRQYVGGLGDSPEQHLLREVMKKVVRLAAFSNLDAIHEDERLDIISGLFIETIEGMGGEAPPRGKVYKNFVLLQLDRPDLRRPIGGPHQIAATEEFQIVFGPLPRRYACHFRHLWSDGSVRHSFSTILEWSHVSGPSQPGSEWLLILPDASSLNEAHPGDVLVVAMHVEDEEVEVYLLPQDARITRQIAGALESRRDITVLEDGLEEFVRELLHARL